MQFLWSTEIIHKEDGAAEASILRDQLSTHGLDCSTLLSGFTCSLFELINTGRSNAAIHTVFTRVFGDCYDEGKTQRMIDHARLRRYKPYKRATVKALVRR